MLRELEIVDYGLIARAAISFARGATMFTGETGSGKTMLLGALGFAFGDRAGADAVRVGAEKARVTLTFAPDDGLRARLCDDGFELDPDEDASIVRELSATGRSSVRVNGRPATAAYVREIGAAIAEIVGQHDAQRLLSSTFHLALVDRCAGEAGLDAGATFAAAYRRASVAREALDRVRSEERDVERMRAQAQTVHDEIGAVAPTAGEDVRLGERRSVLEGAERIQLALATAHDALGADDRSAVAALGEATRSLGGVAGLAASFAGLAERAGSLQSEATELAAEVMRELEALECEPSELERINARLSDIERLQRRYGGSLDAVLAAAAEAHAQLDDFAARDARTTEFALASAQADEALSVAARALTDARGAAGRALEAAVAAELGEIALGSARFAVAFEALDMIGAHGAERVVFSFAANPGQPLRPLARVASGGELARLLLALVVARAESSDPVALVFDEIDAGIGGATAAAVGARIGRLARASQVVCITHLAQIATWAERHYVLDKLEADGSTTIAVRPLDDPGARETEIARMLSGESHAAALQHARALLRRNVQSARGAR